MPRCQEGDGAMGAVIGVLGWWCGLPHFPISDSIHEMAGSEQAPRRPSGRPTVRHSWRESSVMVQGQARDPPTRVHRVGLWLEGGHSAPVARGCSPGVPGAGGGCEPGPCRHARWW
jgi:hypothetical protein